MFKLAYLEDIIEKIIEKSNQIKSLVRLTPFHAVRRNTNYISYRDELTPLDRKFVDFQTRNSIVAVFAGPINTDS